MTIDPGGRYQLASKARLVFDPSRNTPMLLYPERGMALSEVAAAIARLCAQPVSVAEIAECLGQRYPETSAQAIERDVLSFLGELERRGLLQAAS